MFRDVSYLCVFIHGHTAVDTNNGNADGAQPSRPRGPCRQTDRPPSALTHA